MAKTSEPPPLHPPPVQPSVTYEGRRVYRRDYRYVRRAYRRGYY